MLASSRNYAIGMVHFQIVYGWRLLIGLLCLYLAAFFGGVGLYQYAEYAQNRAFAAGFRPIILTLLLALEGVVLVLLGGYLVSGAIRTDLTTRMIESHRLMPIPAWRAVLGYLLGAPSHAIAFALLNVILTLAAGGYSSISLSRIALNQFVVFAFALFVWSLVGLGTFFYRHIFFVGVGITLLGICSGAIQAAYWMLPGFTLLMTPFIGDTTFSFTTSPSTLGWTYALAIAGQAAFFALFFAAACRRYRGTYPTTFNIPLAVLLLACWTTVSAIGIYCYDSLYGGGPGMMCLRRVVFSYDENTAALQAVTTLLGSTLLAMVPLWTFAQSARRKAVPLLAQAGFVTLIAALAAASALGAARIALFNAAHVLPSALAVAAQVAAIYLAFTLLANRRGYVQAVLLVSGLLTLWLGPLVVELIRILYLSRDNADPGFSFLGTLSPIGLLISIWTFSDGPSSIWGLCWQWTLVLLLLLITWYARSRVARSAPPSRAPQPASDQLTP